MSREFNRYRLHLVGYRRPRKANRPKLFKEFPSTLKIDVEITTGYYIIESGAITGEIITGLQYDIDGNPTFTGYSGYSYPYSYEIKNLNEFSGFNFYSDISVGKRIRQDQINVGNNNRSAETSKAGIVGVGNSIYLNTGVQSAQNDSSYIFGNVNTLDTSRDAIVVGSKNKIDSANLSISIGDSNRTINSRWDNLNLGFSNLISGHSGVNVSSDCYNIGWLNKSINTSGIKMFGEANSATSTADALVLGDGISLLNSNQINAVGKNLSVTEGWDEVVIGRSNRLNYTYQNIVVGVEDEVYDSSRGYLIGKNNLSSGDSDNYILGKSNESILDKDSHILGDDNLISNSSNLNLFGNSSEINKLIDSTSIGERNKLDDSYGLTILGKGNVISGVFDGIVLGQYNRQDYNALEDLHRVALTGANGQITGYYYDNSYYNGLSTPKTAGDDLYVFGKSNNGTENYNTFVFGQDNIAIENYKSHIIGNENIIERTTNSFIFGELNRVSGVSNYVIGRANILNTGAQNSVLIGISHEPTQVMNAEARIASINNYISVTPSEVKISSSSPVKFNDSSYFLTSDEVVGDVISSSGPINPDASGFFMDTSYNKIPEYLKVVSSWSSVPYDLKGAERFYTVVSYGTGQGSEQKTFNITSYFSRIENNFQNVVGQGLNGFVTNSSGNLYISNNRKFYTVWQSGKWHLKDFDYHSYLFNATSSNTGVMPINGWQAATNVDTSGISLTSHISLENFDYYPDLTSSEVENLYDQVILPLGEVLERQPSSIVNNYTSWWTLGGPYAYMSTGGYAIVYGHPKFETNSGFLPRWLMIDTYSTGVYLVNNDDVTYPSNTFPWENWFLTGYGGIESPSKIERPEEFILSGNSIPQQLTGTYKLNLAQSTQNDYIYYNQYNSGIRLDRAGNSADLYTFASGTNRSSLTNFYGNVALVPELELIPNVLTKETYNSVLSTGYVTGVSKIKIDTNLHQLSGMYTGSVPSGRLYYNNNLTGLYLAENSFAYFFHPSQNSTTQIEQLAEYYGLWSGPNIVSNSITGFILDNIYSLIDYSEYPATGSSQQLYTVYRSELETFTTYTYADAYLSGVRSGYFYPAKDLELKMKASQTKLFKINIPSEDFGVGYLEVKY